MRFDRTSWMSGVEPLELELEDYAVINTNPYNHSPDFQRVDFATCRGPR